MKTKKKNGLIVINTYSRGFIAILVSVCFFFLLGVRTQVNHGTTGDEPHYLLMDYSIIHDRDLSLANNYKNNDAREYDFDKLEYQGIPMVSPKYAAKQYSTHGIGLPVILLPGYLIKQKTGAVFEMALLATAVICLTWVWVEQVTKNRMIAFLSTALLALCYFFNGLVGAIYPDMIIAAMVLIVLIATQRYYRKPLHQFLIGAALGFLILLHLKTLAIVMPALLVLSYKLWKSERKLPWLTFLVVAAFIAFYFLTLHRWFGSWSLTHIQGGQSFSHNPFNNLSAMLFDSSRGLLVYNPIWLLAFVGLPIWFKRHKESFLVTLIIVAPSAALLCMVTIWNGGPAPVGRYIMEFLPALVPAIAFAIEALRERWQRAVVAILAILTFLITLDNIFIKLPYITSGRPALFVQIQKHIGLSIDRLLPAYYNTDTITRLISGHGFIKLAADYLVITMLLIYGYNLGQKTAKIS